MIALSNKSKQYGLIALKVLILCATFGYIYIKIVGNENISISDLMEVLNEKSKTPLFLFVLLALVNWCFEILKWKTVVSVVKNISFATSTKQSLAALSVSLATPNRVGEYGAKAYFFEKEHRKKILLLNLFSNSFQMASTTIFGLIGLVIVASTYALSISVMHLLLGSLGVILLFILGYIFKERELLIKGFSIANVFAFYKKVPVATTLKTGLFSVLRYAIFGALFFLLLNFFGAEIDLKTVFPLITAMYLLTSVIPTIFVFDVVVKGGVALWLFSLSGIPELTILSTVFIMWLLNFVLPALLGSFYVLTYKQP